MKRLSDESKARYHDFFSSLIHIAMNATIVLLCFTVTVSPSHANEQEEPTLVQTLLNQYAAIESVACDVRRDVTTPDGTIRWLSRVYYRKENQLHAANARPQPRLIIADGNHMYQHTANEPRGFKRAIDDLDRNMRINLKRIPGTIMEHLLRLKDTPETVLEPSSEAPTRRAYEAEHVYAILEADDQYRLLRILFFQAQDQNQKTGEIVCEQYEEVLPGTWIAKQHHATFYIGDNTVRERTRFTNYEVNVAIADEKFLPAAHFSDEIEWVDSFNKL